MKNSTVKASLVTTVFNEADSIENFVDSIKTQSVKPSEVIIVDAGSKDRTQAVLKEFAKKNKNLKIKIFVKKGNRSVGRNEAIKKAKNKVIAVTDAGCILHRDWLREITRPFHDLKIDVVAGFYKPVTKTIMQKCFSVYTCVMEDNLDKNFLPSSRSVAFAKKTWESIGGYPENLNTCEDLVFAKRLKKKGFKFFVAKKAIVFWPQRKNLQETFLQFFMYALGDGKAHYFRKGTPFLFLRIVLFVVLVILSLAHSEIVYFLAVLIFSYLMWSIAKNYKYVKNKLAFIYLPILQISSDIAVFLGTSIGLIISLKDN